MTYWTTYYRYFLFVHTNTAAGVVDKWGLTSLGEAVDYNQLEVVKCFITEHGVNVDGEL